MRTTPDGGSAYTGQLMVDTSTLGTTADTFEMQAAELARLVSKLTSDLDGLYWRSPAGSEFRTRYEQWQAAQQQVNGALQDIAGGLRTGSTQYGQTEEDSQAGIARAVDGLT